MDSSSPAQEISDPIARGCKEAVATIMGLDASHVRSDDVLTSSMDSLDLTNLGFELEERFKIDLPLDRLRTVRTVRDLCDTVARLLAEAGDDIAR